MMMRLSGWEFTADPGDGAVYHAREEFPNRYVEITVLTATKETSVSIPFSVLKLIAHHLQESGEALT